MFLIWPLPRLRLVVVRSLERCHNWENRRNTFTLVPCIEEWRLSATTFSTYNHDITLHYHWCAIWYLYRCMDASELPKEQVRYRYLNDKSPTLHFFVSSYFFGKLSYVIILYECLSIFSYKLCDNLSSLISSVTICLLSKAL